MRPVWIAGFALALIIGARASTMEASTKTYMVNTCNGPVAVAVEGPSCNGGAPVALPLAVGSGCNGSKGLLAGIGARAEARREGRQAKRATKNAVKASLRACAVPVAAPQYAVQAVPYTAYRPVTVMQPYTQYQYQAVPVQQPLMLQTPCKPQCEDTRPTPQPEGDPPLSAIPEDHRNLTSKNFRS